MRRIIGPKKKYPASCFLVLRISFLLLPDLWTGSGISRKFWGDGGGLWEDISGCVLDPFVELSSSFFCSTFHRTKMSSVFGHTERMLEELSRQLMPTTT